MTDVRVPQPWLTFTGCVLATAILYWAQAVIVPIAFATLMAFLLTPVVTWLQRWVGRVSAVIAVVALAFAALGLVGWLVAQQLGSLLVDLPTYQQNLEQYSQVALLVAVAFWAWLWGPLGFLLATPLTVCLAVMGKYVPGLEFVSTLISDEPVLAPDVSYYQRLLAGDQAEAIEIAERYASGEVPAESTYDAIMLPALNYSERDRIEGRLTADEERSVIEATREILADAPVRLPDGDVPSGVPASIRVLGVPANGEGDVVALRMFADLLDGTPIALELQPGNLLTSEIVEAVQREAYRAVCIADLPPSPPSKSRNIAKRLRAIAPDLPILVGRWAPPPLADENEEPLRAAGASHVAVRLTETRDYLTRLLPEPAESAVAKPRMKFFRFSSSS